MKQFQYHELQKHYGYYRRSQVDQAPTIRLIITQGKRKGELVIVSKAHGPKIAVHAEADKDDLFDIHYTALEHVDENGAPAIVPVTDMTGRAIEAGNWVVYSVSAGRSSHALELGRVAEVTKTGALKVERTIQNGEKVGAGTTGWYRNQTHKTVNDPDRSLMLPVEVSTLTMWVMTEFENLGEE